MKLLIIGAGPGGYETAISAAEKGLDVTVVSDGPLGGTCLNEGCIPTKTLCRNAQLMDDLRKADTFGLGKLSYAFDYSKVLSRKEEVISSLRQGIEFLFKSRNIRFVSGKARFKDAHTVLVKTGEGETELTADRIIIATGSESADLPVPGADLEGVLNSSELLGLSQLPRRLCIVGGGVIGLEFASVFNSFSSEVTVVEFCRDILPRFDTDLSKRLKQSLSKRGISIETSASVQKVEKDGQELVLTYLKNDRLFEVRADKVLMAVGRRPAMSSLNLDAAAVAFSPKGIEVNAKMQTSVPDIYAVGDVTGGYMLAHVASAQGRVALASILGEEAEVNTDVVPAAVFTNPEVASVGRSEDECRASGIAVKCPKAFFRANGKAVSMGEPEGFCKLVVAEESSGFKAGSILGCHIMGPHSSDLVQEVAALMHCGASVSDLRAVIHSHPSLSEVVQAAANAI